MTGIPEDDSSAPDSVTEVNARGQRCPLPVIALAAAASNAPPGTLFALMATDPATRHDVPAWCRMRGHELVSTPSPAIKELPARDQGTPDTPDAGAELRFVVRLGAGAQAPPTR